MGVFPVTVNTSKGDGKCYHWNEERRLRGFDLANMQSRRSWNNDFEVDPASRKLRTLIQDEGMKRGLPTKPRYSLRVCLSTLQGATRMRGGQEGFFFLSYIYVIFNYWLTWQRWWQAKIGKEDHYRCLWPSRRWASVRLRPGSRGLCWNPPVLQSVD